jgi:hypothetical protein
MKSRIANSLLITFALCGIHGCSGESPPPTGTVSGTMAFATPPTAGMDLIIISPSTGKAASTKIEADGNFSFPQPMLVGEYTAYLAPQADPNAQEAVAVTFDKSIPDKFWNEIESPLRVSISEGENTASLKVE